MMKWQALIPLVLMASQPLFALSETEKAEIHTLLDLSLEDLMNVQIISASKKETPIDKIASAVFILNSEDIRRSGHSTFAELMRLVPGFHVAALNASHYSITSRGFNKTRSNKVLVLIDGRSQYTQLYAGVFWDQFDYILEDIERIEVIRGSAGSVWGTNAVNAVVNIITKKASQTQGFYSSLRTGTQDKAIASLRYGGKLDKDTSYRLYGKYRSYDGFVFNNDKNLAKLNLGSGDKSFDEWEMSQSGFVIERDFSQNNHLSISAESYNGVVNDANNEDNEYVSGENINLLYTQDFNSGDTLRLQSYYQHFYRRDGLKEDSSAELRDLYMADIDITYAQSVQNHHLTYGSSFRTISDNTNPNAGTVVVNPQKRTDNIYSLSFQDEYHLRTNTLIILGTKLENIPYTKTEMQPSLKLLKHIDTHNTLWASISKAVRLPSRLDSDSIKRGALDLKAESSLNYEIGHRLHLTDFYLDNTLFVSNYDNLIEIDGTSTITDENNKTQYQYNNIITAKTWGFESTLTWKISEDLKIGGAYSYFGIDAEQKDSSSIDQYNAIIKYETTHPLHQFNLHSYYNLNSNLELDSFIYYVDSIQNGVSSSSGGGVPSNIRADVRLAYCQKHYSVNIGVQRALSDNYAQYSTSSSRAVNVERNIYAELVWKY
jgi:iron complex outermembrane recepter protein